MSKKKRIAALEQRVAKLEAEVKRLRVAPYTPWQPAPTKYEICWADTGCDTSATMTDTDGEVHVFCEGREEAVL